MSDPKIQGEVVATGSAVNSMIPNLGVMIEAAMVVAIHACYARGVTDPDAIKEAKMVAFKNTVAEYDFAVSAAQTA